MALAKELIKESSHIIWSILIRVVILFTVGLILNLPAATFLTIQFAILFGFDIGVGARTGIGAIVGIVYNLHVIIFFLIFIVALPLLWAYTGYIMAIRMSIQRLIHKYSDFIENIIDIGVQQLLRNKIVDNAQSAALVANQFASNLNAAISIQDIPWVVRIVIQKIFRGEFINTIIEQFNEVVSISELDDAKKRLMLREKIMSAISNITYKSPLKSIILTFAINIAFILIVALVLIVITNYK